MVVSAPNGKGSAISLIASHCPLGAMAPIRSDACSRRAGRSSSAARELKKGCKIRRKRECSGGSYAIGTGIGSAFVPAPDGVIGFLAEPKVAGSHSAATTSSRRVTAK